MIPFDFAYCRPDSLEEAAAIFQQAQVLGQHPVYYGGGSEIITLCRGGGIRPGIVIDLKGIPECRAWETDRGDLVAGAVITLNTIAERKTFPLLANACSRIADHTNQCRITLGGNLSGTILYRETSLPLMLSEATIVLYGPGGLREEPFNGIFRERLRLAPGEFVVRTHIPAWALRAQYLHIKKTPQEKIDYPLVNISALKWENEWRFAFSGLCRYPFRNLRMERVLNDRSASIMARVEAVASLLPESVLSDAEASGAYRLFVWQSTLRSILEEWEHGLL